MSRSNNLARTAGEDTLQRSQAAFGSNHLISLAAAAALTCALTELDQTERARILGEDALQRSQAALGPDQLITQTLAQALKCLSSKKVEPLGPRPQTD